jgi:hypothetical protein
MASIHVLLLGGTEEELLVQMNFFFSGGCLIQDFSIRGCRLIVRLGRSGKHTGHSLSAAVLPPVACHSSISRTVLT